MISKASGDGGFAFYSSKLALTDYQNNLLQLLKLKKPPKITFGTAFSYCHLTYLHGQING